MNVTSIFIDGGFRNEMQMLVFLFMVRSSFVAASQTALIN